MRTTLLAAFFSLSVASTTVSAADIGVPAYRIETPNGEHGILIGSMHVPHPRLLQPSPRVLDNARVLVIEHTTADEKPDFALAPEVLAAFSEGRDTRAAWASFVTKPQLVAIQRRLACNPATAVSLETLETMLKLRSPRMMSMLAYIPCSPPTALSRDAILETAAATRSIPIRSLELQTEVEQRRRALGDGIYLASFKTAVSSDIEATYERLVEAINNGDFDAVAAIATSVIASEAEREEFRRVMVNDRNRAWMPKLRAALDAGGAVVVVGAAHLPGREGLIAMLRQSGYRVQKTMLPTALSEQ